MNNEDEVVTEAREITDKGIEAAFDILNLSVDNMNRSARVRGFIEGVLVAVSVMTIGSIVTMEVIKKK